MSSVGVTKSPLLTAQVVDPVPSNEASPFEAPNFEVQRWDGLQPYWPLLIPVRSINNQQSINQSINQSITNECL